MIKQSPQIKRLLKQAPSDKNVPEFQSFIHEFFTNKKKYRPPAYANLVGEGNRCKPAQRLNKRGRPIKEVAKLSLHQSVVNMIMKLLAFNPQNRNRGLLAWHSTGSGKTLTATAVMDAFWDTNRQIVYVSSVEGKNANPPETFYANARKFLTRFKNKRFSSPDPEVSARLVGEEFKKRQVKFMTFAQLAHYLLIDKPLKSVKDPVKKEEHKNYLNNAVVILDEVHNIFKPLPHQKAECDAIRKFLTDPSNKYTTGMKLVVLTATPGDSPKDILDLLNIVRDQHKPVIEMPDVNNDESMQQFKEQIYGLVSFFDMSGDHTKFPKVEQEPNAVSNMSREQYEAYVDAYNKTAKNNAQNNYDKLSAKNKIGKYMAYARKYSNMLFKVNDSGNIASFSSKLADLLERIKQFPNEKHYVYSSFFTSHGFGGQGIMAIAKILKEALSFTELRPSEVTKAIIEDVSQLPNGQRFVVATTPSLTRNNAGKADKNLRKLVSVFNSPLNARGEKIQVFLASQGYNEGLDLRGVRHIHIFDPLVTMATEKQTIGRAARHCSHSDLSLENNEWTVKVHRYYADKPIDVSFTDTTVYTNRLEENYQKLRQLEDAIKIYKNIRTLEAKAARANNKNLIRSIKSQIKADEANLKRIEKRNYNNVRMVDRVIRDEAVDRMQTLSRIYQAVYDTAVDCHLFKEFHALAGYNITCASSLGVKSLSV